MCIPIVCSEKVFSICDLFVQFTDSLRNADSGLDDAGQATLGLFLIPEISQTFLRTRTHNLLVTALVPLACIAFLDLLGRRRWRDYAAFGAMSGLAILASAGAAVAAVRRTSIPERPFAA